MAAQVYISSGVYVQVGDRLWGRVYSGDGNKPKLVHGQITSIEDDAYTSGVDIETGHGKTYRLPPNCLHLTRPKPTVIEDDLGEFTKWEG